MNAETFKYEAETEALQKGFSSDVAMILIIGGTRGTGCSIKTKNKFWPAIPGMLREIANQLEVDATLKRTLDTQNKDAQ